MFPGKKYLFPKHMKSDNCESKLLQETAVIAAVSRIGDNVSFCGPFQAYLPFTRNKSPAGDPQMKTDDTPGRERGNGISRGHLPSVPARRTDEGRVHGCGGRTCSGRQDRIKLDNAKIFKNGINSLTV